MEAFLMILNFFRGAFVNFVNHELKMERKDAATVWCNTRDERCAKHAARVEKANHEVEHDGNCVEFSFKAIRIISFYNRHTLFFFVTHSTWPGL